MADYWPNGSSMIETVPKSLGCFIPPIEMNGLLYRISMGELDSNNSVVGALVDVWPARGLNPGLLSRFLKRHGMNKLSDATLARLKAIRPDDGAVLLNYLMKDFTVNDADQRARLIAAHHQVRRDVQDEERVLPAIVAAIVTLADQGQVAFDAGSFLDWCATHTRVRRDELQPVA